MIRLNGVEIKPTIFPDGTSQVTELQYKIAPYSNIFFDFENESEIIQLLQILDYHEHAYSIHGFTPKVYIEMPFMPYGRQDKKLDENYFGKGSFLRLIKGFSVVQEIETLDIHSTLNNYGNIINKDPIKEISKTLIATNPTLIAYPDQGAESRYRTLSILEDFPSCSFSKDRDQETGYIKNLFLNEMVDLKDQDVLIIDDICDGGMTFKLCAEKLLQCGAKSVNLYTTHGIYSKGIQTLKDSGISRIFNRKGEVTDG